MTNFIFKSSADLQKIRQQLLVILNEQRHQRADLRYLTSLAQKLQTVKALQTQVDDYYNGENPNEDAEPD